jgi:hypothetical protein
MKRPWTSKNVTLAVLVWHLGGLQVVVPMPQFAQRFHHGGPGAVEVATPLLMPKRADVSDSAVVLMDRTGLLVSLPFDPMQPFCRMVARERIVQLKRYHIGKVCRSLALASAVNGFLATSMICALFILGCREFEDAILAANLPNWHNKWPLARQEQRVLFEGNG